MATISRGSKAAAAGKRLNIGGRCDHRNHVDFSYPSESILMRCMLCAAEVDHAPPAVRLWAESRFGHAMADGEVGWEACRDGCVLCEECAGR